MTRKEELVKMFEGVDHKELVGKLIEECINLEERINCFRFEMDHIIIMPETIKKYKFYHSCYKDYLNQYTQVVKCLMTFLGKVDEAEVSPLRAYFEKMKHDQEF